MGACNPKRSEYSATVAPLSIQTGANSVRVNRAFYLAPFNNRFGFSINRENSIIVFISCLLFRGRPSTVARLVMAFFIRETIQGVLVRWTTSQIRQKCFKGGIQEPNARAAVPRETFFMGIGAAFLGSLIGSVLRRFIFSAFTMMRDCRQNSLASQTPAGHGITATQMAQLYFLDSATFAMATPKRAIIRIARKAQHQKAAKSLSRYIHESFAGGKGLQIESYRVFHAIFNDIRLTNWSIPHRSVLT